jgi:hypothetical protein
MCMKIKSNIFFFFQTCSQMGHNTRFNLKNVFLTYEIVGKHTRSKLKGNLLFPIEKSNMHSIFSPWYVVLVNDCKHLPLGDWQVEIYYVYWEGSRCTDLSPMRWSTYYTMCVSILLYHNGQWVSCKWPLSLVLEAIIKTIKQHMW